MFLRRLFRPFVLICNLLLASWSGAAERVPATFVVIWEGNSVEELNVRALAALRQEFPSIPFLHLINPSYFQAGKPESSELIARTVLPQDEIGLYLVPTHALLKEADVLPRSKPTFWGYSDESDFCRDDCGQHVPLSVYSRDEVLKIFWTAHEIMQSAGFKDLKSYAVRGWMAPPGIDEIAKALGYTNDLTRIDPSLVAAKLKEFPISRWISVPAFEAVSANAIPSAWVQKGGVVEFNPPDDIAKRLKEFTANPRDARALFSISLSQENGFMNRARVAATMQSLQKSAADSGIDLSFQTASGAKNSRPLLEKVRLSRNP